MYFKSEIMGDRFLAKQIDICVSTGGWMILLHHSFESKITDAELSSAEFPLDSRLNLWVV